MGKPGRRLSTEQTRLLIALVGALANSGDALMLSSVVARLGISEQDGRAAIDALVDLGGLSPAFAVTELEEADGLAIPSTMGGHGKILRLTASETFAIDSALKRLGVYDDDPLRASILEALSSPSVTEDDLARAARQLADPQVAHRVMQIAQALYYGSGLRFSYRGSQDESPRERIALPLSLREEEGVWYLEAADTQKDGAVRSFRVDRMDDIAEDASVLRVQPRREAERMVGLVFNDPSMLDLLDWPRMEIDGSRSQAPVRARMPYYGGLWLVRRLAACGGTVEIEDEELAQAVRAYAADQL